MMLLPGLIDAHVHILQNNDESTHLLKPMAECADLRFASSFAILSESTHSQIGQLPKTYLSNSTGQAAQFVQERIDEGADYVGVVADTSSPTRDPERLGH